MQLGNKFRSSDTNNDILEKSNFEVDKIVQVLIYGLFFLGVGLAYFYSKWLLVLMALGALAIYIISHVYLRKIRGTASALSLSLLSSHIVLQMEGAFQFNVLFFIVAAVSIFYMDRRVLIPVGVVFFIHHLVDFLLLSTTQQSSDIIQRATYVVFFIVQMIIGIIVSSKLKLWKKRNYEIEKKYIAQSYNLESSISYAKEIASGNYDVTVDTASDDILGQSLREMSKNLKTASQEDRNRSWAMAGIAKISEIIRVSNNNMEELSNQIVSYLVKYLGAAQGGIFVLNDVDINDRYLELKGCYAYERKKYVGKKIDLGQGLLGQAVIENDTIYLTEVPQNYLHITSGLGETNPNSIIIVPLKTEEEVVGALEIASFSKFEDHHREFLKKVSENIASSIIFSKNNDQTSRLLDESQVLAEQLKAQEEEMRQNMEELQATQEDLQRKNAEMEKAEQELTSSKDYLNSIIEAIPTPIFVKDSDLRMIMVNQTYCDLTNDSRENILYKTDFDRFSKEEADVFSQKDLAVLNSDKLVIGEEHFIDSTGKARDIITTKAPFKDKHGNKYIVGSVMDITDRKQLENNLSKEKYLIEALLANTNDLIYFKDLESKFIRVSTTMAKRFKVEGPEKMVGFSDFDFFTQEHAQPAYDDERKIIKTGKPIIDFVEKETWGDGSITYVSTTKMPLQDLNGSTIGTFGISRDVTKGISAESDMVKKERLYKLLLENVSEINTIIDDDGKIKYLSPSYFKIFNREEKEVINRKIYDIILEKEIKELQDVIEKIKETPGKALKSRFSYQKSDGKWIAMEAEIINFLKDEAIEGIIIRSKETI